MAQPTEATIGTAALDAFVEAIRVECDPCRQARLLAFVRKRRGHTGVRALAEELVEQRETYWGALEILTDPNERPPTEGPLWIEPISNICFVRIPPGSGKHHWLTEFWLARHPVTNAEYARMRSVEEPYFWRDPLLNAAEQPAVGMSWEAAEGFCGWLMGARLEQTGLEFALPTKQQWEFACRAGSGAAYCFGDDKERLGEFAWCEASNDGDRGKWTTHPVGLKKPNAWGLCDMHGNVWEWCWDMGEADYNAACGGCSWSLADECRSDSWRWIDPGDFRHNLGFRPAAVPVVQ